MKDSGVEWIGEIPESWNMRRVKSFYKNHKDVVGRESFNYERLALTLNGVIKRNKEDTVGLQPENFDTYQILRTNELVFKLIDLQNVSTSRVGYSVFTGIVSPAYIILTPKNKVYSKFGEYYFKSMWQREIFNHIGDDGVRSSLNASDLLNIPYPIIEYSEQQKIAAFLDEKCGTIDEIISKTEQSIEEYKKLKQLAITKAVTKGIRPDRKMKDSNIDWIGPIPEDWTIMKLRYLYRCQNGISKSAEFFGRGFPFVAYKDVYNNDVLPESVSGLCDATEEELSRYSVKKGDIFFTRTSETIEEIGLTSICLNSFEKATFAGFLIRCRPYTTKLDLGFSKYYMASSHLRFYFVKEMNLVTRASLGQELLKNLQVLIPSHNEQKEIADYLDEKCAEIDILIEKKQKFLVELTNYKKSLIYEYVTGKKEVA